MNLFIYFSYYLLLYYFTVTINTLQTVADRSQLNTC